LASVICSDNPIWGTGSGAFWAVINDGADKKTLYCVDKIPSSIALTFLISDGIRSDKSAGALAVSFFEMCGRLPPRQKSLPETTL